MMSAGVSNDENAPAVARMGHRKRKKEGGGGVTYATVSLAGAATSIIFVATSIILSRQAFFCRDKRRVLSLQK